MPRAVEVQGAARGIGGAAGRDVGGLGGASGAGLMGQVEHALVEALTRAPAAGEWAVVSILAGELTARRTPQESEQAKVLAGSNVSSVEAA